MDSPFMDSPFMNSERLDKANWWEYSQIFSLTRLSAIAILALLTILSRECVCFVDLLVWRSRNNSVRFGVKVMFSLSVFKNEFERIVQLVQRTWQSQRHETVVLCHCRLHKICVRLTLCSLRVLCQKRERIFKLFLMLA